MVDALVVAYALLLSFTRLSHKIVFCPGYVWFILADFYVLVTFQSHGWNQYCALKIKRFSQSNSIAPSVEFKLLIYEQSFAPLR